MKRFAILLLALVFATSIFAFEQGTKTVGGWIGYESDTWYKDADPITTITINPWGGYFFIDNVCGIVFFDYTSTNSKDWDDPITSLGIGIGGRYFYNDIYGGLGFMMRSTNNGDYKESANFLNLSLGYLYGIAENVYVDLGGRYYMGIGEYGGDGEGDNEQSGFEFGAGIDIFFP